MSDSLRVLAQVGGFYRRNKVVINWLAPLTIVVLYLISGMLLVESQRLPSRQVLQSTKEQLTFNSNHQSNKTPVMFTGGLESETEDSMQILATLPSSADLDSLGIVSIQYRIFDNMPDSSNRSTFICRHSYFDSTVAGSILLAGGLSATSENPREFKSEVINDAAQYVGKELCLQASSSNTNQYSSQLSVYVIVSSLQPSDSIGSEGEEESLQQATQTEEQPSQESQMQSSEQEQETSSQEKSLPKGGLSDGMNLFESLFALTAFSVLTAIFYRKRAFKRIN